MIHRTPPRQILNGWLNIDKPVGMGSTDVVRLLKKLYRPQKIGHAGTLDPLADGVLPIALGEATKAVPYLMDATKEYRFTVRWGEQRTTGDRAGDVCATSDHRPTRADIEAVMPRFLGKIEQVPPVYSALKVNGQRAYDLARAGTPPVLAARTVRIDALSLMDMPSRDEAVFEVTCGKGTYIRTLAEDMAAALDTVGHVKTLTRLRVGHFQKNSAIGVDFLTKNGHSPDPATILLDIADPLDDILVVTLPDTVCKRLISGQRINAADLPDDARHHNRVVLVRSADDPVAFCRMNEHGTVQPVRILNMKNIKQ